MLAQQFRLAGFADQVEQHGQADGCRYAGSDAWPGQQFALAVQAAQVGCGIAVMAEQPQAIGAQRVGYHHPDMPGTAGLWGDPVGRKRCGGQGFHGTKSQAHAIEGEGVETVVQAAAGRPRKE